MRGIDRERERDRDSGGSTTLCASSCIANYFRQFLIKTQKQNGNPYPGALAISRLYDIVVYSRLVTLGVYVM